MGWGEFQDLFHRQTPEPPQCHLLSKNREKYSVPVLILMLNYTYTLATVICIFECESVNEFHTLKPELCSVAGTHGNKHQSSNLGFEQNPFCLVRSNCRFLDRTTSHYQLFQVLGLSLAPQLLSCIKNQRHEDTGVHRSLLVKDLRCR